MRNLILAGASAAALLMTAGTASAATILLESTFEEVAVGANSYVIVNTASGWTKGDGYGSGDAGIEVQNNVAGAPAANGGQKFVELDSTANSSMYYTFSYTGRVDLSFLYSPRPNVPADSNGISVLLNGQLLNPPLSVTGGPIQQTDWQSYGANFSVQSGDILSFSAVGTNDSLGGYVDNITISAVPEPATWAMMIIGFASAGSMVRSARRKQALAVA